jgi:uncharacterized protein YbjT (DUF2867 family)
MFVILGASGNTGHVVANKLLGAGKKVRVVGRSVARLQTLGSKGAEVFVADASDDALLSKAMHGAEAAYVLIPPDVAANDFRGFQDRVSDAIAKAVQTSGLKHVVALSSFGADKANGTGPVAGLFNLEQKLNQVTDANVLYLRAGYFMENTLPQVAVIRTMGSMAGPVRPDLKLPMIATRDIGEAAADALMKRDFRGKQTKELQGQRDLNYTEMAAIIGEAILKPSLGYVQAPEQQLRPALEQMGMSTNFIGLLLEMAGALNSGYMKTLEPRSAKNTTPTSFERFVEEEFVPAYREQTAA